MAWPFQVTLLLKRPVSVLGRAATPRSAALVHKGPLMASPHQMGNLTCQDSITWHPPTQTGGPQARAMSCPHPPHRLCSSGVHGPARQGQPGRPPDRGGHGRPAPPVLSHCTPFPQRPLSVHLRFGPWRLSAPNSSAHTKHPHPSAPSGRSPNPPPSPAHLASRAHQFRSDPVSAGPRGSQMVTEVALRPDPDGQEEMKAP